MPCKRVHTTQQSHFYSHVLQPHTSPPPQPPLTLSTLPSTPTQVFPTSVRSLLSGSVNIFGRIGGFVTPILFQWSTTAASAGGSSAFIIHAFPYWLMGLCALIASVLILMLPETAQAHQPDSSKVCFEDRKSVV